MAETRRRAGMSEAAKAAMEEAAAATAAGQAPQKKPFYKKPWFIALVAIFLIAAIGGGRGNSSKSADTEEPVTQEQVEETEETVESEEEKANKEEEEKKKAEEEEKKAEEEKKKAEEEAKKAEEDAATKMEEYAGTYQCYRIDMRQGIFGDLMSATMDDIPEIAGNFVVLSENGNINTGIFDLASLNTTYKPGKETTVQYSGQSKYTAQQLDLENDTSGTVQYEAYWIDGNPYIFLYTSMDGEYTEMYCYFMSSDYFE